jgi:hypothetical protein
MKLRNLTPRGVAIVYFALFAVGWLILAAALVTPSGSESSHESMRSAGDVSDAARIMLLLAAHAALIALVAWKAPAWFFAHGMLAVVAAGLPLVVLLEQLWLVPAFFYVIAEIYVYMASRRETTGRLQAEPRHRHQQARI